MYKIERFESYIDMPRLLEVYFDFSVTYAKCKACDGFAKTWACPDYSFDTREFLAGFDRLHFIVDRVSNEGCQSVDQAQERLFAEKNRFDKEMRDMEKKSPGSAALAAQECVQCKVCLRTLGKPCCHPEIMRYGLESLGALPTKMVRDEFGFEILWSDGMSIPEYYVLAAGVLEKTHE